MERMLGYLLLIAALIILAPTASGQSALVRERLSLNSAWRFQRNDPPVAEGRLNYERIKEWVTATGNQFVATPQSHPSGNLGGDVAYTRRDLDDRGWRQLDLPHDWGVEGSFKQEYPGETGKLPWWGVAWYRKHFEVDASEKDRRLYLDIDGAMANATVWLNGQFVGGWPYGYASFELDLTPYVQFGADNVIAIRLDNPPDSSRWYPGGGIYRNVWLVKTAPVHVSHWGTYVTTPEISKAAATVDLKVTIQNNSAASASVKVTTQVYETVNGQRSGKPVSSSEPQALAISAGASDARGMTMRVSNPKLWNLEKPNLYAAVTTVAQN